MQGSAHSRLRIWQQPRVRRLRSLVARAAELFPLTLRGVGVLACMAFALWFYGLEALDGVWFVAGIAVVGLCAVALVSVLLAALRMRFALARSEHGSFDLLRTETQRLTRTTFTVPRLRFWLFVDVHIEWITPAFAQVYDVSEGGRLGEEVRLSDHGELRRVVRRVVIRDVFGLASLALRKSEQLEIDVLPHAGALRALPLLRSLAGGDDMPHPMGVTQGDRLELRRYAAGDPARFIHWKAFARTQKLVVRMPERALSRAHRVAAFLIAAPGDGASAGAARVALEERAFGDDFRFGADGMATPVSSVQEALVTIVRSSAARAEPAGSLRAFVDRVEQEGAFERVRDVITRRSRPVRVVIGIDGLLPAGQSSLWRRLAFSRASDARLPLEALRETISAYRRHGCDVVVLDRESGRVLGEAHLVRAAQAKGEAA
jgi:uncharacterized protein (DUF58 family)